MLWPLKPPNARLGSDASKVAEEEQILDLIAGRIGEGHDGSGGLRLVRPPGRAPRQITASSLRPGLWLLVCHASLEGSSAVDELQEAFLAAREQGAESLVVDLGELDSVSLEGIQLLVAIADIVEADGGRLWLACRDEGQHGERVVALEGDLRRTIERLIASRVERLRLPIA